MVIVNFLPSILSVTVIRESFVARISAVLLLRVNAVDSASPAFITTSKGSRDFIVSQQTESG